MAVNAILAAIRMEHHPGRPYFGNWHRPYLEARESCQSLRQHRANDPGSWTESDARGLAVAIRDLAATTARLPVDIMEYRALERVVVHGTTNGKTPCSLADLFQDMAGTADEVGRITGVNSAGDHGLREAGILDTCAALVEAGGIPAHVQAWMAVMRISIQDLHDMIFKELGPVPDADAVERFRERAGLSRFEAPPLDWRMSLHEVVLVSQRFEVTVEETHLPSGTRIPTMAKAIAHVLGNRGILDYSPVRISQAEPPASGRADSGETLRAADMRFLVEPDGAPVKRDGTVVHGFRAKTMVVVPVRGINDVLVVAPARVTQLMAGTSERATDSIPDMDAIGRAPPAEPHPRTPS